MGSVGYEEGAVVGAVGDDDGSVDGNDVGSQVGVVGDVVGSMVGTNEGCRVGLDGIAVGAIDVGETVGEVGLEVG